MIYRFVFVSLILPFLFCNSINELKAQTRCETSIVVSGQVFDSGGGYIPAAMVVNRHSGGGVFVERDGSFLVRSCPGDTLVFGAVGFYTTERSVTIEMRDSSLKINLNRLKVDLGIAEVYAPRALREILNDIEALGYNEQDYRISGVDALKSPITFLYEQFSKREQSRRLASELENADRRRDLLQELFSKYVDYDIVQLKPEEFDDFADFCDPGDKLLKEWTQYEFILYVKRRYILFRMLPPRFNEGDYRYDLD